MKKIICILLSAMFVLCLFTSCSEKDGGETTTTAAENSTTEHDKTTTEAQSDSEVSSAVSETETDRSTKSAAVSTEADESNGSGGGYLMPYKYRDVFYVVSAPFVEYVGKETYLDWFETVNTGYSSETMLMKQFIEHFGITREQFDRANLELAKIIKYRLGCNPCVNPKDYTNQLPDEIFNADIIYTFDDDIIREYYLTPDYPYCHEYEYEEAVKNGEYTSQTEEWVDIEKMEAEINAKYGTSNTEAQTTAGDSKIDFLRELFSKKK